MSRVLVAVVVGIVAALLTALVGIIVAELGSGDVGRFLQGISWLVGVLAGVWYYFTGRTV